MTRGRAGVARESGGGEGGWARWGRFPPAGGTALREPQGDRIREPPLRVLSCAKGVAEEGEGGAGPWVSQDSQRLAASASDCISKVSTASTAVRSTPGNQSRNCWTVAPSLRFSKRAETGTRVPANTHAPLAFSGSRSTAGHVVQSAIVSPSWSVRRTGGWVKRVGPFDRLRANGLLTPTPLDSCLRRNDAWGVGCAGGWVAEGEVPACAGTTGWGAGATGWGFRVNGGGGGWLGRRLGGRRLRRWRRGRRRGRGLARGRFLGILCLPGACCPRRGLAGGRRGLGS